MSGGYFITFEGPDGVGKSAQSIALHEALIARARRRVWTFEPRDHKIRALSCEPQLTSLARFFLFMADRAQHVETFIRPRLQEDLVVLCDRYCDSTVAYQWAGAGISWDIVQAAQRQIALMPDLTFILTCPPEVLAARIQARTTPGDFFETQSEEHRERVRAAYLSIAKLHDHRCVLIDAHRPEAEVAAEILAVTLARLQEHDKEER